MPYSANVTLVYNKRAYTCRVTGKLYYQYLASPPCVARTLVWGSLWSEQPLHDYYCPRIFIHLCGTILLESKVKENNFLTGFTVASSKGSIADSKTRTRFPTKTTGKNSRKQSSRILCYSTLYIQSIKSWIESLYRACFLCGSAHRCSSTWDPDLQRSEMHRIQTLQSSQIK
jgi:hypothetical protein